MMVSVASTYRLQRSQEQKISSVSGRSAAFKKPDRRLSLTLLYFSTAASIVTSITYLLYRLTITIRESHANFTVWTVLLVEILTSGKITCTSNMYLVS